MRLGVSQPASWRSAATTDSNLQSIGSQIASVADQHQSLPRRFMLQALRMAASSLHHDKSYLGDKYRRLRAKLGAPKAITAWPTK
jgi:hypothetical protein